MIKNGYWSGDIKATVNYLTQDTWETYLGNSAKEWDPELEGETYEPELSALSEFVRDNIKDMILGGSYCSLGYDVNYDFTVECTLDGENISFSELSESNQEDIINCIFDNCYCGDFEEETEDDEE